MVNTYFDDITNNPEYVNPLKSAMMDLLNLSKSEKLEPETEKKLLCVIYEWCYGGYGNTKLRLSLPSGGIIHLLFTGREFGDRWVKNKKTHHITLDFYQDLNAELTEIACSTYRFQYRYSRSDFF